MGNGLKNNDDKAWAYDLGFKIDRLNQNLERQIKIWSWWAVFGRAIINAIGYLIGLAILAAILALLAGRVVEWPKIGNLPDDWSQMLDKYKNPSAFTIEPE